MSRKWDDSRLFGRNENERKGNDFLFCCFDTIDNRSKKKHVYKKDINIPYKRN